MINQDNTLSEIGSRDQESHRSSGTSCTKHGVSHPHKIYQAARNGADLTLPLLTGVKCETREFSQGKISIVSHMQQYR